MSELRISQNDAFRASTAIIGDLAAEDPSVSLVQSDVFSNTRVGTGAGEAITSGQENIVIGEGAGVTLTTGSGNVIIGTNADVSVGTLSNTVSIGNNASAEGNTAVAIGHNSRAQGTGIALGANTLAADSHLSFPSTFLLGVDPGTLGATLNNAIPISIDGSVYYLGIYS